MRKRKNLIRIFLDMNKKKIDNNNLIPWFMDDHQNLPADYLESCQRFFLELDRKQSEKAKTYTKRYIEWRKGR